MHSRQTIPARISVLGRRGLTHGLNVSLACNSVWLVWLYAAAAHTQDIRARIPFLLAVLPTMWITLLAVGIVVGLIGLLITGGWRWSAVGGVVLGSACAVFVVRSGIMTVVIPAGYESPPRYWLVGLAVLVVGVTLWRQRALPAEAGPGQ
jgi:hypothetical protein